jgi:transposase-like protein
VEQEDGMGLFDKMFSKKNCVICGKELGLLGKTKLGDESYLCKDCSGKLSPHFHGYRSATADDIRAQLAYREDNARVVAAFNPTTTIDGGGRKILLDEVAGKLIITSSNNWRQTNPDVLDFSQVTGCDTEVRETREEIKREDKDGKKVSFNPPRYDYDYDIYVTVHVNHPYFSELEWKVNDWRIEQRGSAQYHDAESKAYGVRDALLNLHAQTRAAAAPKQAVTCPHCGATTLPDANGRCEYCGGAIG